MEDMSDKTRKSSPFKSMYLEANGWQQEEVKAEDQPARRRSGRSSVMKDQHVGGTDIRSPNPNSRVDAKIAHLRKNGAIPASPEQVDFRGRMLAKSPTPNKKGSGGRSISKSASRRGTKNR